MLRTIQLYGSLEKAAGFSEFQFDCDNQQQLFAALRGQNDTLDMALRGKEIGLVKSKLDDPDPAGIPDGFNFCNAEKIHVAPTTKVHIG